MRTAFQKRERVLVSPLLSKQRGCIAAWRPGLLTSDGKLRDFISETHHAQLGSTSGADSNDPLPLDRVGGRSYLYLPGAASNYASVPDAAALDITGDLDLRIAVAMTDWTPAANQDLISKYNGTGNQRSFLWWVPANGRPVFLWSADGAATNTHQASAAPTVADGELLLLRVTVDVDDGAGGRVVTFYTKASTYATAFSDLRLNSGWTQLGTAQTGAATISIFSGSADVLIGSFGPGTGENLAGNVLAAAIYSGIAGTEVLAVDFTNPSRHNAARTSLTAETGQTVTLNRSASGRKAVVVDRPVLLFGTDDYVDVADDDILDIGVGGEKTVAVAFRRYGTGQGPLVSKKTNWGNSSAGWALSGETADHYFYLGDGSTNGFDQASAATAGITHLLAGVVRQKNIETFMDGVGSGSPTTRPTGTTTNALALRFGQDGSSHFSDFEFFGAAIFSRALALGELAELRRAFLGASA